MDALHRQNYLFGNDKRPTGALIERFGAAVVEEAVLSLSTGLLQKLSTEPTERKIAYLTVRCQDRAIQSLIRLKGLPEADDASGRAALVIPLSEIIAPGQVPDERRLRAFLYDATQHHYLRDRAAWLGDVLLRSRYGPSDEALEVAKKEIREEAEWAWLWPLTKLSN